jgi:predicted membrane-bound mannosyltransferase
MRWFVTIIAALMVLGAVAASGLILARKGTTPKGNIPTATMASTVYVASATQEVSAPTRVPSSKIAQATGSEASPLILQANADAQSGNPITTVTRAPSAAAAAPNVKDQSLSSISKVMVHEVLRLKDDAMGWAHKLQELELDLKLLDLKKNQDIEATGRDINEYLVMLRAAASRLAPDAAIVPSRKLARR